MSSKYSDELITKNNELLNKITNVYAQTSTIPKDELDAIWRYAKISSIGASTRIENALLTDSEISWIDTILTSSGKSTAFNQNKSLIENKLSKDRERSIEEVAGCRNILLSIYDNAKSFLPLRESDIRALHSELMLPFIKNSQLVGCYKKQPNFVVEQNHDTGESRVVFKTADAGPITQAAMSDLISWYNKEITQNPRPLFIVCEFVYRFLAIHPFQDGNGRLGRALFLMGLLQCNQIALSTVAKFLAIDRQIERHKEEYYFALNACSKGQFKQDPSDYKVHHFINFMLKMIEHSLADIDYYRDRYQATIKLSTNALEVFDCFKENPETRLTTKKILVLTSLPRRTITHSLKTLLDNQLIQKYGQGAGVRYQLTF